MYCMMHGVPLPATGSFAFHILAECISREQASKVAFVKFLVKLVGPLSGLSAEDLFVLESAYAEQVYQFKYNYKYTPVEVQLLREHITAKMEDMRILDKVGKMTVPDKARR